MSINNKIFLPTFSTRLAKPEEWEGRRTPPNQSKLANQDFLKKNVFSVFVPETLYEKFNDLLQFKAPIWVG